MKRIRYHPISDSSEEIRKADAVKVCGSAGDEPWGWLWNCKVPTYSRLGMQPHKNEVLELVVDSPEQVPDAMVLILQIKEGKKLGLAAIANQNPAAPGKRGPDCSGRE